jgi:hypothetical protein
MIVSVNSIQRFCLRSFLVVVLAVLAPVQLQAAELKLEVKLIWGTNDAQSPDPTHKMVDDATAAKLRNVFKWKNYFQVNRQTATIPSRTTRQIELSKKCSIEITELQGPSVEVTLIGEGNRLNKTTRHLAKGEWFTIGGEDKNGCAWFVIVTELDEK